MTVFVRLLESSDKALDLSEAIRDWRVSASERCYEVPAGDLAMLPGSPVAYWASGHVREVFSTHEPLGEVVEVMSTNPLNDDFRYGRVWWEVRPHLVGDCWVMWAKGGRYSPYYYDVETVIRWSHERQTFGGFCGTPSRPTERPASLQYFFRPGLTWPRRTSSGLGMRVLPKGGVFGDKGPAAFVEKDDREELLAYLAVTNSEPFRALLALHRSSNSLEVGALQRNPVPRLNGVERSLLSHLGLEAWQLTRKHDFAVMTSHAFLAPPVLRVANHTIRDAVVQFKGDQEEGLSRLRTVQRRVDQTLAGLYALPAEDLATLRSGLGDLAEEGWKPVPATERGVAESLLEWTVGVAFGRFDIRLTRDERPIPQDPDPFDPLPVCSPGMLQDEEGLPATASPPGYPIEVAWDGILVDDEGHSRDIVRHIRRVLSEVSDGQDWAAETEEILGRDLRSWAQRSLFEDHIKRYSKSRRKAPIFWRLGTPSGSYSVWLYYPRATGDTLFRVLNDYVEPKLRHEESTLLRLRQEAGASPTASQQKRIEAQETLVSEVQDIKGDLEVLAQLWRPEFDDGVVLNFAPFWRLVAHTRKWQKECQKHWKKLREGEYEWSYTAMRLWPERVVPACAEDRSFAIAHGLEEEFFPEEAEGDGGGTSQVRENELIQKLVDARSSAAVKQALHTLLER